GLGGGRVGRAIAGKAVGVDAAAVDVAGIEPVAVRRWVGVAVEIHQPAIGGLLVRVVGDRAKHHGVGRVGAGLSLVIAGLHEMEQVVVGPVAGLGDGGALRVPGEGVGGARALA